MPGHGRTAVVDLGQVVVVDGARERNIGYGVVAAMPEWASVMEAGARAWTVAGGAGAMTPSRRAPG